MCIASFRKQAFEDASSIEKFFCENLDYFDTRIFFGICFTL